MQNRSLHVTRLCVNGKPLELQMGSKDVNLTAKSSIVGAAHQSCQAKEISTRPLELSSIQPSSRHTLAQLSHTITGFVRFSSLFERGCTEHRAAWQQARAHGLANRLLRQATLAGTACREARASTGFVCLFPHRQTIPWSARAACPTYTLHDKNQTKPTEPPSLHEKMFPPTCF